MVRHVGPTTNGFMILAVVLVGCANPAGPAAGLSGRWVVFGVDTDAEFLLVQRGTAVTGTFSLCSAMTPCTTHYEVSGTVLFRHVVLRWTEWNVQRYDVTFDATLAGDTLAGRTAVNGQPPGPTTSFRRTPGP